LTLSPTSSQKLINSHSDQLKMILSIIGTPN